jgi:protein-S-isoprenylcysteine O-methyltransferase Ste14
VNLEFDRYLLVRGASLYLAAVATGIAWTWRRPPPRVAAAATLAFFWNLPALLLLNVVAPHLGWWRFDATGGLLLGVPVDLLLAWSWLWGAVPILAFPDARLSLVIAAAFSLDLVLMPAAAPVVRLESTWLWGEAAAIALLLVPAQLLARWTARDEHLTGRALLQVAAFSGLLLFLIPAIAIDASGSGWTSPLSRPTWEISLMAQLLAIPAVLGLTAVQEFVTRGGGTPVPFDPPRRIVTSGVYSYVRSPMQLAALLMLGLLGLILHNVWIAAAGIVAHLYSAGLAGWDEQDDLTRRFCGDWTAYRRSVPRWIPRWRPWVPPNQPAARLFVAESCGMCSEVGQWFLRRRAAGLDIVAAESHPRGLRRVTYESGDGRYTASGIAAIARALEHVHLLWAFAGFVLRLPIVGALVQLLADASGAEPRAVTMARDA